MLRKEEIKSIHEQCWWILVVRIWNLFMENEQFQEQEKNNKEASIQKRLTNVHPNFDTSQYYSTVKISSIIEEKIIDLE